jgi:hypothetical protein
METDAVNPENFLFLRALKGVMALALSLQDPRNSASAITS